MGTAKLTRRKRCMKKKALKMQLVHVVLVVASGARLESMGEKCRLAVVRERAFRCVDGPH